MAITSVSSPSSSSSSSPTFTASSPATSRSSPVSMSTATLNMVSNGHFSAHQDYPSSSAAVKSININTNNTNTSSTTNGNSTNGQASYSINGFSSSFSAFGFPDSLSSSIPKSSHNNNSVHIGSLTNGLGGLSLSNYAPTTSSSLSSGLYSYSNNSNTASTTSINTSSLLSVTNSNTSAVGANGATLAATANGAVQEEISTIFVVGFPDDMQEREFQNMFVFTPGFEAATLKIPNKDPQEDDALTLDVNGVNPRKQIIGFAKFRSHQEALQAIQVLSGRRVDAEKGSLLKAEMAKKNLHTRRGLSNELTVAPGPNPAAAIPPTPIGITSNLNGINNGKLPHPLQHRNSLAGSAAYDAFHSVPPSPALPSDLLSPHDYSSSYDFYADVYAPNNTALSFAESFGGRHQPNIQQQQQPDLSSSFLGRQNTFEMRVDPLSMGSLSNAPGGLTGSIAGSFPNSISNSFSSNRHVGFSGSQRFNKSFLDLDAETPVATSGFLSKSIPAHTERGFNSTLFHNDEMTNGRFQGLPINTVAAAALASPSMASPGLASPAFRAPINPGDQNPPCNTLYVGNLPMNTSEDELRTLFSRCVGYRRLCFRTKSNGPMCFVEFENVECATQALNDLYGNPLSNSVKGGIRLSFSKNPLGVRNSTVNQPSGLGHLHNMNGTPFLDRRDSMSAMFDQHY
ncbi:hypothetical protein BGZ95_003704 [Linnemannia exigua]|uniref:RRM domain-containing protein n=1 Tax=Linnemannia exigua TaxID=604196 RepID=A0AAD4D481_9FUNG|nr:hypothetical protein BGZ95_003704 [Linnemannia exigua]